MADCDAIALIGHNNVASTARPKNKNFPHTCWMNFLPAASSTGAVELCVEYCVLAPYVIGHLETVGVALCALCVETLSRPSKCNLALRDAPGAVCSPNRGYY